MSSLLSPITQGRMDAGEMFEKNRASSLFIRPQSTYTDFEDAWSDDESHFEEEEESPRESFDSSAQSQTTMTSYNVVTPAVEQKSLFEIHIQKHRSIQGPQGPHLFRSSVSSAEYALQLSPVLPKAMDSSFEAAMTPRPAPITLAPAMTDLDDDEVRNWTSQQVAAWMHNTGFEDSIISRFEENDIDGAVLLELQFEDLKELDIPSFGKRHQIWAELAALRSDGGLSPSHTDFQDITRPCTTEPVTQRRPSRKGRAVKFTGRDALTPGDSVSIVAIEQLIPKPHKCSRGERCPKWKKQQRMLDQLDREYGLEISPTEGGQIFIAGFPGQAETAPRVVDHTFRPTSDAGPSVVASSDLLGPGQMPELILQQQYLDVLDKRDPQENVKQFLTLQTAHASMPDDTPPSPPMETPQYDMFPPLTTPRNAPPVPAMPNLRQLPRLSIPIQYQEAPQLYPNGLIAGPHRNGTPASEMDVPVTNPTLGPLDRDASQSVPPNMQFRPQIPRRPSSRGAPHWKRGSLMLPPLPESAVLPNAEQAAKVPENNGNAHLYGEDTTQAGWMKKRKARLLRHEWNEHHFRLQGTQLAMHKTDAAQDVKPLEKLNIDDYNVACSSLAHDSKLAAALKTLKITSGKKDGALDEAAFAFSLIPAAERAKVLSLLKDGPKAQHFAVTTRDQRIDWMRSIMLAKALKQREQGCEVTINGQKM